ncbi:MAG: N-acetylmuramoyl-L-alanine amidase [Actinomycetota bacterium]|nr:N-acetylmuramoyl-L-alanine amidase [Actinomycetota bacterium]
MLWPLRRLFRPLAAGFLVAVTSVSLIPGVSAEVDPVAFLGPNGEILPVISSSPNGTVVSSSCGTPIAFDGEETLEPVDVVLDPGHGGPETGSVGSNGLTERTLNLAVARHARDELVSLGYTVALTRDRDLQLPIRQRAAIANALSPRAFVSIHHNGGAVRRSETPGTETFHQVDDPESARLAGILFEDLHAAFAPYWVSWVDTVHQGASVRLRDGRTETYGVLRLTPDLNSAIIEALYLSNPPEAALLVIPEIQAMEGQAIAGAIDRFLTSEDPGSGFRPEFYDPHTTGTGTARGCHDPELTPPTEVSTGFTAEEYETLAATAHHLGRSTDWVVRFGVHTLKFLSLLPDADPIRPLDEVDRPDAYGPISEVVPWDQAEHAVLIEMADAYGLTRTQVQKLGAVLMVFLTGLEA